MMARSREQEDVWVHFLSVDPGFINQGYVYGRYHFNETESIVTVVILKAGTEDVIPKGMNGNQTVGNYDMIQFVDNWCFRVLQGLTKPQVVIIEEQYVNLRGPAGYASHRLAKLSLALASAFHYNYKAHISEINTSEYKQKMGLKCGSRYWNKKKALEFATETYFAGEAPVYLTDHVADALNQLAFWLSDMQEFCQGSLKLKFEFPHE